MFRTLKMNKERIVVASSFQLKLLQNFLSKASLSIFHEK